MPGYVLGAKASRAACILVGFVVFGAAAADALQVRQNEVAEWQGQATRACDDPFNEVTLDALVTLADGSEQRIPAFWGGKQEWRFRFSSPSTGRFPFRTVCSDTADAGLHDQRGVIEVTPYRGSNPFFLHGPVHLSADRRYFAHADGTPFFWLADSWWHAMSSRLTMDGFKTLVADRAAKGFNVIRFAVAHPCDIAPFDDRGGNEYPQQPFGESASGFTWGNWPWEEAMHWPGSTHIGVGKRILEKYAWWRFEPHPEWLSATQEKDDHALVAAAAGIPGEVRIFYFAKKTRLKLLQLDPGMKYCATFISPLDGKEYPVGKPLEADDTGSCAGPRGPINQDWVLVLKREKEKTDK